MRQLAGAESQVYFAHLSKNSSRSLNAKFAELVSDGQAEAVCHESGVLDLIKERLGGSLEKVCLLDPKAEKELSPEDGDGRFEWFLFGVCLLPIPPRALNEKRFSGNTRYSNNLIALNVSCR